MKVRTSHAVVVGSLAGLVTAGAAYAMANPALAPTAAPQPAPTVTLRTGYAPCRPPSRLEAGACVTHTIHVRRVVVVVPPAPVRRHVTVQAAPPVPARVVPAPEPVAASVISRSGGGGAGREGEAEPRTDDHEAAGHTGDGGEREHD